MKICTLVFTGACLVSLGLAQPATGVTSVSFVSLAGVTRVSINISTGFRFSVGRLSGPDRIFFDFVDSQLRISNPGKAIPVGDSLLKQIRMAETRPGVSRVVLDLNQPVEFSTQQLSNPNRLVVELRPKGRPETIPTSSPLATSPPAAAPVETPAAAPKTVLPPTPIPEGVTEAKMAPPNTSSQNTAQGLEKGAEAQAVAQPVSPPDLPKTAETPAMAEPQPPATATASTPQAASSAPISPAEPPVPAVVRNPQTAGGDADERRVGFGVKASSLGVGGEVAFRILRRANLRAGFNAFDYNRALTHDGITYDGQLNLRSAEAHFDYFLVGGFHISPSVLLYNGDKVNANASVPGGQTFSLNGVTYESGSANPVTGTGQLSFNKLAPALLFGLGNLVPRGSRRWTISFEFGAAYEGPPKVTLGLAGSACTPPGTGCTYLNVATPSIQGNVLGEQSKLAHDISFIRFYPIVSLGFGIAF